MKMLHPTSFSRGEARRQFVLFDDFEAYASGSSKWTLTATSGGTAAINSGVRGGTLRLNPNAGSAANNDDGNFLSTNDVALLAADKPLMFESKIGYTEVATNVAAVLSGMVSAPGLNTIVDGGLTPKTSYSGAVWFKPKGSLLWSVQSSLGATQTTTITNNAAPGDGTFQSLGIEFNPVGSIVEVAFTIDGVIATDVNNKRIKHNITLGSPAAMKMVTSVKNGSAAVQVVDIDYMGCQGLR